MGAGVWWVGVGRWVSAWQRGGDGSQVAPQPAAATAPGGGPSSRRRNCQRVSAGCSQRPKLRCLVAAAAGGRETRAPATPCFLKASLHPPARGNPAPCNAIQGAVQLPHALSSGLFAQRAF